MKAKEQGMVSRHRKAVDPEDPEKEKKTAERQAGTGSDDSCRCKEASKMTPRKLLGVMIGDLAFWKKANKG